MSTYRSRHKPVNVADVEDLTVGAGHLWAAALELDVDGGVAQVGGHGEVGNGSSESDGRCDVVEDSVATRHGEAHGDEGDRGRSHDTTDSPVPVGAMSGDADCRRAWVLEGVWVRAQSVIAALKDCGRHLNDDIRER